MLAGVDRGAGAGAALLRPQQPLGAAGGRTALCSPRAAEAPSPLWRGDAERMRPQLLPFIPLPQRERGERSGTPPEAAGGVSGSAGPPEPRGIVGAVVLGAEGPGGKRGGHFGGGISPPPPPHGLGVSAVSARRPSPRLGEIAGAPGHCGSAGPGAPQPGASCMCGGRLLHPGDVYEVLRLRITRAEHMHAGYWAAVADDLLARKRGKVLRLTQTDLLAV